MPKKTILILLDDIRAADDIVVYARGLAERMDAGTHILMLLRPEVPAGELAGNMESMTRTVESLVAKGERALARFVEDIQRGDPEMEAARLTLRVGDPASEFLKFLAANPVPHCVVWGGDKSIFASGRLKAHSNHWLAKVEGSIPCPVVAST